jgi:hypothetical protein
MNEQLFDGFTRRAADTVSRRSSLAALSGAALAAGLLAPMTSRAKDDKAKKAKRKARRKCQRQVDQCRQGVGDLCLVIYGSPSAGECILHFDECCQPLASCDVPQAVACAVQKISEIP